MRSSSSNGKILMAREIFPTFDGLLTGAVDEVVLVSPFIGHHIFSESLAKISRNVSVTLVTRWSPHEIAGGLNDLRIWEWLQERGNSQLLLKWDLHAKYYRGDSNVILGSGNLTKAGLNFRESGNSEIMLSSTSNLDGLQDFESSLIQSSVEPTVEMYQELIAEVERIRLEEPPMPFRLPSSGDIWSIEVDGSWKPRCEMPDILFEVYERRTEAIDVYSVESALRDLEYIQAPDGLTSNEFKGFVRNVLAQSPLFPIVLAEIAENGPVSHKAGQRFVKEAFDGIEDAESELIWQASMRWLAHFYPEEFEIRRY